MWNTFPWCALTSRCRSRSQASISPAPCECPPTPPAHPVPWGTSCDLVPVGLPMSEQYVKLEEERRQQQRLEKDKRRRRRKERAPRGKTKAPRHSSAPTESDEDIAPAQRVDIVTEEMPEVRGGCRGLEGIC